MFAFELRDNHLCVDERERDVCLHKKKHKINDIGMVKALLFAWLLLLCSPVRLARSSIVFLIMLTPYVEDFAANVVGMNINIQKIAAVIVLIVIVIDSP